MIYNEPFLRYLVTGFLNRALASTMQPLNSSQDDFLPFSTSFKVITKLPSWVFMIPQRSQPAFPCDHAENKQFTPNFSRVSHRSRGCHIPKYVFY